ncbi:MAG: TIGR01777 family protein, partial [Desulfofustis sp.]|nr:TIGR01777 family protein [Desulfofustis sp.]
MNILITGASGLVGSALAEFLFAAGHSFFSLQRAAGGGDQGFWNFARISDGGMLPSFDAVIHLAGENIAAGRWTARKKKRILESRVTGTTELARFCADLPVKPRVLISASAIGYYGNRGNELLTETSTSGTNFVAEVCRAWEDATEPARQAGIRVVNGRIGMVLSGAGGTLSTMLPSFKLGIAGVVGSGEQYVSWIGIDDLVRMFLFLLERDDLNGPVNLVAPEAVTNRVFTKTLGKVVG